MSVSFYKTGVINAGGDAINKNLCIDTTKDVGQSHGTYAVADFNFSESLVNGNKYTVSAHVTTSSDKKGLCFYHSGGSYQMGSWMPISSNGVYTQTFTASSNMASQTSGVGHGFCRVYVSNNEATMQGSTTVTGTAHVDWLKVESGEVATPWCQNVSDVGYVGVNHGFVESGNQMKMYDGHIETTEFIEF